MTTSRHVSRRSAFKLGAAAAALPLVHIRTAGAAGKLTLGFWDHWIPKANDTMNKQVNAWAEKNKVEVMIDYITSNGFKFRSPRRPRHRRAQVTTRCRSTTGRCRPTRTSWNRSTT